MDLSVIVPARNEQEFLAGQLDALIAQEWHGRWEIIVIDNGSTDATADIVRRYAARTERVRLLVADRVADRSYAVNAGVELSRAPRFAVCDADDVVAVGWLAAMATGLEHAEVVTGPNELRRLNPPWLVGSRGWSGEEPVASFLGAFPTIRGNNFGAARSTWELLGGFDPAYRFCEDAEFSFRCREHGIDVVGLPDAVVHYRYRTTTRALWRQGLGYGAGRPHVARDVRRRSDLPLRRVPGWKSWASLVVGLPTLVRPEGRAAWVWIAANRFGHVVGSVRHRTLLL